MWVWQQCLSSVLAAKAPCNPTSWTDIAEMLGVAVLVILAPLALALLLEFLSGLFPWPRG